MSLQLKKNYNTNKFDTVELIPSADNYGKPSRKVSKRALPSFSEHQSPSNANANGIEKATSIDNDDLPTHSKRDIYASKTSTNGDAGDDGETQKDIDIDDDDLDDEEEQHKKQDKFGTFDGVLGRCLLCMWGVIMFLRTGWIVGNAGIWQTTLVMILSASITMFTTLSLSAICTNGEISHGGPYFLISRSLGPNLGGVIGLLFAVGNCVGVALHLVGFAEAIVSLYHPNTLFPLPWDIVMIAEIGLIFLFLIALRGVGSIIKFNLFLLFLMFVSIIAFFIGTFIPTAKKESFGYTGYSSETFAANWGPAYLEGFNFLTMVAIFFPSVTGCMAGANISGDLKNPAVNIPVGTSAAVIFSMVVYVIIAWMLGACVVREEIDPQTGTFIDNVGLYHNYVIMSDISLWRPLVDMGIYASTFSSATSCFVAAPRIFKAVCDDGLFPIFNFFAVGRSSDNEPVRCYVLVVVICFFIMLSGDINFIAPMVTNFFLITYALVNYSVFAWDISKSPGWRPSFKYYSKWLSLFATVQSVVLMFLIDWIMALVTVLIGLICYKYIESRDPDVNWGTTVESKLYLKGCKIALKYQKMNTEHAKIARPTFLMMLYNSNQNDVIELFNLAKYMNYAQGLIMIGHIIVGSISDPEIQKEYVLKRKSYKEYSSLPHDILQQCIMECCIADNYEDGTRNTIQLAGMGGMQPNVFMIKIDQDLEINDTNLSHETKQPLWFSNLTNALLSGLGIIMIPSTFDLDKIVNFNDKTNIEDDKNGKLNKGKIKGTIDIWWLFDDGGLTILTGYLLTKHKLFKNYKLRIMALDEIGFEDHTEMVSLIAKLRINAEIQHVQSIDDEIEEINQSVQQIYIDKNIADKHEEAEAEENGAKATTTNGAHADHGDDIKEPPPDYDDDGDDEHNEFLNDDEVAVKERMKRRKISQFARDKIVKYRRVGRTIEKYSSSAKLCLLTMPYPRKKFEWWEYSQIIHYLSPKEIPTIFVRGTSEQVLTFCF